VLTVSAAAAASCPNPGLIDWSVFADGSQPVSITNGGVTMTLVKNDPNIQDPGNVNQGFQVTTILPTPLTKNYRIAMGGNGTADTFVELVLTFSLAIKTVAFQLVDIDQGGFIDRASVTATNGGGTLPLTSTLPAGSTVTLGAGTDTNPWINSATGVNYPIGASGGSINVAIAGPLNKIVIRERRGLHAADGVSAQHIGLTNLTWCR
jgi:hypothetical protein